MVCFLNTLCRQPQRKKQVRQSGTISNGRMRRLGRRGSGFESQVPEMGISLMVGQQALNLCV